MEKKKYRMQWGSFIKRFLLWFLGIPINVVPVFFKQLGKISIENFPGLAVLASMTVADFDFSFISVSVVFVLCLGGFFADDELSLMYKRCQAICVIYSMVLVILYCVFFFNPDLYSIMNNHVAFIYNSVLIGLTIILGVLCNATVSMKARVST